MTYLWVGALTACQVVAWFGWFIVEIIIHSMNSDYNSVPGVVYNGSYLQLEITQSMQIYQYEGVILAGTIAALHLAASIKTRAARVASFVIQMFAFLAWFWELYFIIPTFVSHGDSTNLFCNGLNGQVNISTCRLAVAVAAFAVIMQFFQSIILIYSFVNMFIPPMLDDGSRKEIIEEDDAEVGTVVAANPAGYEAINRRVGMFSSVSLTMVLLTLTGYAILMYSMIDVVYHTGFMYGATVNPQTGQSIQSSSYANYLISGNIAQLGDPILSINFRQLSIVLVFALATSAYACFRHNRGIQAGAFFLTCITALQWWSWIIEGGRYLHQYNEGPVNPNTGLPVNNWPALDAQRAMYAGACIIVAGETIRTLFLMLRYYTYIPVTRNNIIPTYIRHAFATANPVPVILFAAQVAVTLAWYVLQFVHQSDDGMFAQQNATQNIPVALAVTDTLFIWQCLFFVSVFIPELFSERTKTLASKQAALAVNITVISAWFLLVWPWTYAGIYRDGFWQSAPGGFCDTSIWGHDNCPLLQGAAILSVISGGIYVLLALYQLARIISMLPTPGQVATLDGTVVDALPPTVGIQKALGWNCALLLIGLLIWALAAIDTGSGYVGWRSFTFGQFPGDPTVASPGPENPSNFYFPSAFDAYSYSVAFGNLIIIGFTVWSASELSSNAVVANWHSWRTLVTGLSGLLFSFFIPLFIMTCRFINWNVLDSKQLGMASGIIIMCIGDFMLYASALIAQRSPLIALPAAVNNTVKQQQQQPQQASEPLRGVSVHGGSDHTGGYGATSSAEPTQVAVPTREYSGTQQPAIP